MGERSTVGSLAILAMHMIILELALFRLWHWLYSDSYMDFIQTVTLDLKEAQLQNG